MAESSELGTADAATSGLETFALRTDGGVVDGSEVEELKRAKPADCIIRVTCGI